MIKLPIELEEDINSYCKANNITDIDSYVTRIFKSAQTIEKYGATPMTKERIVEKIVEKIVEVDKNIYVDVPVEKIVEKEIYISDDSKTIELTNKITSLEYEAIRIKKEHDNNIEILENKNTSLTNTLEQLKKELDETKVLLEEEKNKKRKDIYGE